MPINDAVAGKDPVGGKKENPLNKRVFIVQDLANAALRGDITTDEWESLIEALEPVKVSIRG